MPSRASRGGKRADFAQIAVSVVEQAIGDVLKPAEGKNPHAQALSALGNMIAALASIILGKLEEAGTIASAWRTMPSRTISTRRTWRN